MRSTYAWMSPRDSPVPVAYEYVVLSLCEEVRMGSRKQVECNLLVQVTYSRL